jgi:hypothetical protein
MKNSYSTRTLSRLAMFLVVCGIAVSPTQLCSQGTTGMWLTSPVSVTEQDPDKPASELNHHLAGYTLITIGALVIAGHSSERFQPLQLIWPFLFVAAGLFLAAWSDAEIWPRGNLSWRFLIHHDLEARQHKIYALLLILIGIIEYLRARSKLNRFWRSWAFPLLAVVGAVLLLFHDHGQPSGASSPEARHYMASEEAATRVEASPDPMPGMHHHASTPNSSPIDDQLGISTSMEHISNDMPSHHGNSPSAHSHEMSEGMLRIEREHFWFTVVGLAVALFKFISDNALWRRTFVLHLWPSFVTLLGVLLVLYTE